MIVYVNGIAIVLVPLLDSQKCVFVYWMSMIIHTGLLHIFIWEGNWKLIFAHSNTDVERILDKFNVQWWQLWKPGEIDCEIFDTFFKLQFQIFLLKINLS